MCLSSISFQIEELGRPVSFGEVFIKAHTRKDGTYVDFKAEKVAEAYKKKKEEKLANLEKDNTEISEGLLLAIEEDNELFIQVYYFLKKIFYSHKFLH